MNVPENLLIALSLSLMAGLSTGIGSLIAYLIKRPRRSYLAFGLGLSAGMMIFISFVELVPMAYEEAGGECAIAAFFIGMVIIGLIDMLVPEVENPHHFVDPFETDDEICRTGNGDDVVNEEAGDGGEVDGKERCDPVLLRVGYLTALAIMVHNFPEGMAAFGVALTEIRLGIAIALAIALHNIPEGISVYIPVYFATADARKALLYSLLSGIAEPIGALVGLLLLLPFLSPFVLSCLLASVAGIMVYISVDELLPVAHRYGESHIVMIGMGLGMFIMAVSLLYL